MFLKIKIKKLMLPYHLLFLHNEVQYLKEAIIFFL